MAEGARRHIGRWRPALALLAVGLFFAVDLPSSSAEPEVAPNKGQDVKDTHERLDRIYKRLGIKREERAPPKRRRGCERNVGRSDSSDSTKITAPPALPPVLGWVLIGVVIVAMLLPILLALRGREDDVVESDAADLEEETEATAQPRPAWEVDLEACHRLLVEGRLAEAFAGLHRCTLLSLERADALVLDATSTNWDYVRRLMSRPNERALLSAVTIAAESAVLGKRPPDAARFEALAASLRRQMGGGA